MESLISAPAKVVFHILKVFFFFNISSILISYFRKIGLFMSVCEVTVVVLFLFFVPAVSW